MRSGQKIIVAMLAGLVTAGIAGCERQGPAERAGEQIDDAAKNVQEGAEKAADKVEDAADKLEEKVEGK